MKSSIITIPLDEETARVYDSAAPEERRKIRALLSLWVRELVSGGNGQSLQSLLDEVGRKAKDRGLTPDVLDFLLKDA